MNPKQGLYKHYKGGLYHVLAIASYSEDKEQSFVVYKSITHDKLWVRPVDNFLSEVAGSSAPRFEFIRPLTLLEVQAAHELH